jgi:hypothetical protein
MCLNRGIYLENQVQAQVILPFSLLVLLPFIRLDARGTKEYVAGYRKHEFLHREMHDALHYVCRDIGFRI